MHEYAHAVHCLRADLAEPFGPREAIEEWLPAANVHCRSNYREQWACWAMAHPRQALGWLETGRVQ